MSDVATLARADAASRLRALTDLDATLLVEAGAGSGKTSVLAGRIALLLAAGRAPESIAAISFTEASASELRERVERFVTALCRNEVPRDLAAALPLGLTTPQRAALAQAAARIDALACTTIHGFCRMLLTPWPVEARTDPGATVADAGEAALLFDETVQEVLRERLASDTAGDDALAALFLFDEGTPEALIAGFAQMLRQHRGATLPPAPDLDGACAALRQAVAALQVFVDGAPICEPVIKEVAEGLADVLAGLPDAAAGEIARLLALLRLPVPPACCTAKGTFTAYRRKGAWQAALRGRGSKAEADRLNDDATAFYIVCQTAHEGLRDAAAGTLLALLAPDLQAIVDRFQEAKRAAGLLDFDDLLHGARDLLAGNAGVRAALAGRFRHVLVDEFQDTDPVQADILWRLCGDAPAGDTDAPWTNWRLRNGALFLVGDPKQAIYRFRGADVATYVRARDALRAGAPENVLAIGRNFRSVEPILEWVNERFAAPLGAPGQPGFAPLFSTATAPGGRASVGALDIAAVDTKAASLRDAEAEQVAETCRRLIGAFAVRGADGTTRPCRAGDIALLAPTGTDLWRYERALEDRFLPVATQAGKGFFRRQEVQDLIALAGALADARDTLALGALLRGPLVGMTEEALLDALEALPPDAGGRPARLHLWLPIVNIAAPVLRETSGNSAGSGPPRARHHALCPAGAGGRGTAGPPGTAPALRPRCRAGAGQRRCLPGNGPRLGDSRPRRLRTGDTHAMAGRDPNTGSAAGRRAGGGLADHHACGQGAGMGGGDSGEHIRRRVRPAPAGARPRHRAAACAHSRRGPTRLRGGAGGRNDADGTGTPAPVVCGGDAGARPAAVAPV